MRFDRFRLSGNGRAAGLKQAATLCLSKAHYLAQELTKIEGVNLVYSGEFFHEFVTTLPKQDEVLAALAKEGILAGCRLKMVCCGA